MGAPLNRRAVLGSLAVIPTATVLPAIAAPTLTPFRVAEARLKAAAARFNGLPTLLEEEHPAVYEAEVGRYMDAARAAEAAPIANLREFAAQFLLACDDGMTIPSDDTVMKLVADAKRLTAH